MATVNTTRLVLHIYDCEVQIRCAVHTAYYEISRCYTRFLWDVFRILCLSYRCSKNRHAKETDKFS